MKKLMIKKFKPFTLFYIAFGISIISLIIIMILLEEQNIIQIIDFIKALWTFLIIGSVVYSSCSICNDLFYQLSFGSTRKKTYISYLINLFMALCCLIIYIFIIGIMLLILYKAKYLLMYFRNIDFLEYLSLYIVLNMIFLYCGKYFKKRNRYLFYGIILCLAITLFIFNISKYLNILSYFLLVVGCLLVFTNYRYFQKTNDF